MNGENLVIMYFDGCCEPENPGGNIGAAAYIERGDGLHIAHASGFDPASPKNSNNVAEYKGLLLGLDLLERHGLMDKTIIVKGDSNLVIQQMLGNWQIKSGLYEPFARTALGAVENIKDISFQWIPREQNGKADDLSKSHLTEKGIQIRDWSKKDSKGLKKYNEHDLKVLCQFAFNAGRRMEQDALPKGWDFDKWFNERVKTLKA